MKQVSIVEFRKRFRDYRRAAAAGEVVAISMQGDPPAVALVPISMVPAASGQPDSVPAMYQLDPEPQTYQPAPPPGWDFPLKNGESGEPSKKLIQQLEKTYPHLDIELEINEAKAKCLAVPRYRPTKRGLGRFLTNWVKKSEADRKKRLKPLRLPSPSKEPRFEDLDSVPSGRWAEILSIVDPGALEWLEPMKVTEETRSRMVVTAPNRHFCNSLYQLFGQNFKRSVSQVLAPDSTLFKMEIFGE